MQYSCSVIIDLPIERVVELWDNDANNKHWQDGFQSITLIEGQKGHVGSKSRILLSQGKRHMELTETVLTNELPNEKKALYEHIHMTNTQKTSFEKISDTQTEYKSEVEYTKFNGFLPKLMAKLLPNMFKKQSQKWMDQFKSFAERSE